MIKENKFYLAWVILIVNTVIFSSCYLDKVSSNTLNKPQKSNGEKISFNEKNCNFYFNRRYFFGIDYPKEWKVSKEPPMKDGVFLRVNNYCDIRVYGGYRIIPPDFENKYIKEQKQKGSKVSELISKYGRKGTLIIGDEGGKKLFTYIIIGKEKHCDFYAKVNKDFFQSNKNQLIMIAKTLYLDE